MNVRVAPSADLQAAADPAEVVVGARLNVAHGRASGLAHRAFDQRDFGFGLDDCFFEGHCF